MGHGVAGNIREKGFPLDSPLQSGENCLRFHCLIQKPVAATGFLFNLRLVLAFGIVFDLWPPVVALWVFRQEES